MARRSTTIFVFDIDFDDAAANFLLDELCQFGGIVGSAARGGHEGSHANIHADAAFDEAGDGADDR